MMGFCLATARVATTFSNHEMRRDVVATLAVARHLEIRLPVNGLERCLGCHPERSEGSGSTDGQILRCAQDDKHYLQMSTRSLGSFTSRAQHTARCGYRHEFCR